MSLFTPAWLGTNEKKALRAVQKIHSDEQLFLVVRDAPCSGVKKAALDRIDDDSVLLRIVRLRLDEFSSLGSKRYNLSGIQRSAFSRMHGEKAIAEAALIVKPDNINYLDRISDDDLLLRLAERYRLTAAFEKIRDDQKQAALAQREPFFIPYVRRKSGEGWARLLLDGKIPKDKAVEYAKQMIWDGDKRGVTVIMRHLQDDLTPETLKLLEAFREKYDGRELWAQIGLLGLFPLESTEKFCREMIDGGDRRGLDIMINAAKNSPSAKEAASLASAIRELYRKAKSENDPDVIGKCKALPDGKYGRHADFNSTICGYYDHTDNGVSVHFDAALS